MTNQPPLPINQPIVGLEDDQVGRGWRRVSVNELVRTHYETYLLLPRPHWALGSFFTSDGYRNRGVTHYRAPASLSAWASLVAPLARKWWFRFTHKTPSS